MATAWRIAKSLDTLLAQLNALAPHRSKLSDGSIGDAAHATRDSDHNPWYGPGIVTARDYTHDPANGLDCQKLANALVAAKDPRIKYVIWNRQIVDSRANQRPWVWLPYAGSNPHNKHLHLSVVAAPACDSTEVWALPGLSSPAPAPTPVKEVPDVDARQDALLTGIYQQASGSPNVGEWIGWPSFPDGSGHSLTPVDYLRQADVQLVKLQADLDSIKSSGAAPGSLSDADVARIATAVIDELARRAAA